MNGSMINGPINVIRMEGNINGIKKIIYLFLDLHIPITKQTKCPDYTSLDLYQYLAINLANTKNTIDFMFEIGLSYTTLPDTLRRGRYIDEVRNFFNSKFNEYNIKKKNNEKVNVRFHYIDIRDVSHKSIYEYIDNIHQYISYMKSNYYAFNIDNVNNVRDNLKKLTTSLNEWHGLLFGDISEIKNKNDYKFIKKIRYKYNNPNVLENLQDIYDYIDKQFGDTFNNINKMNDHLDNNLSMIEVIDKGKLVYSKYSGMHLWGYQHFDYIDFIVKFEKIYNAIDICILNLFSNVMDIFFLRRFADKDYINHTIVYTGCYHSLNYIQHLLTKYNFKITHASYSLERNMNKLNDHLKKFDDPSDRLEYEKNLFVPNLIQCSSMVGFPKDFN